MAKITSGKKYRLTYECNQEDSGKECRGLLLETNKTASEITKGWLGIVMSAPLNAGKCPKCKHSAFSDCNSSGSIHIYDGKREIEYKKLKETVKL